MNEKLSALMTTVVRTVISVNGIHSEDLAIAMRMVMGRVWNAQVHVALVELLVSSGMLTMDSNYFLEATPIAKAAHAEDMARVAIKPNMPQAES